MLAGYLGAEVRLFATPPLSSDQPRWFGASAVAQPEVTLRLGEGVAFRAIGLARLDRNDTERSYLDVREVLVQWDRAAATLTVGLNRVFWGVTESRHLVDVINPTDYRADLDGDEKLGQLMGLFTYHAGGLGTVDLFLVTGLRGQRYPGPNGRPGIPLPVVADSSTYEARRDIWNVDYAVRWSLGRGRWNGALSLFFGNAREPQLIPKGISGSPVLHPRYDVIRQAGLEIQWTLESWLWKAEAIVRSGQGPTFAALTGGFEYTTFGVLGSALTMGTILEYSYDGRDDLTYNIYDGDIFAGARLSFNDVGGTELLGGILRDTDTGVTYARAEASRRLGDRWTLELTGRLFRADVSDDPLYWFRMDDHLEVVVAYYF